MMIVSRFKQQDQNDMPMGGVGLYKSIGDQRSLAALWAGTDNFCLLGSGIAIRKVISETLDGDYEIRYFLNEQEDKFDLKIEQRQNSEIFNLSWARKGHILLHGIGMIVDRQMVLAWGELATEWDVVVLSVEKKEDSCLLNSKRASQGCNMVCYEVFEEAK